MFSFLSFALALGVFYSWLLLLSILEGQGRFTTLCECNLAGLTARPRGVKWILPFAVTAVSWWLASWLLAWLQIIPQPVSEARRLEESLLITPQSYLIWKFPVAALLALHLLNSYIYFGRQPVWNYADATAQTLLSPLKKIPLRVGKVDFAPLVGMAVVFLVAEFTGRSLRFLYCRLPF